MNMNASSKVTATLKRQENAKRQKAIKDMFFFVNWLEDEQKDLCDVVPSKSVVPPENINIADVNPGTVCRVAYSGQFYKAKVLQCGTKEAVLKFQQNFEKQQHESESNIDTQEDGKQKALKKRKLISSEAKSKAPSKKDVASKDQDVEGPVDLFSLSSSTGSNSEKQQHESESNIDIQDGGKRKALKKRKFISSEAKSKAPSKKDVVSKDQAVEGPIDLFNASSSTGSSNGAKKLANVTAKSQNQLINEAKRKLQQKYLEDISAKKPKLSEIKQSSKDVKKKRSDMLFDFISDDEDEELLLKKSDVVETSKDKEKDKDTMPLSQSQLEQNMQDDIILGIQFTKQLDDLSTKYNKLEETTKKLKGKVKNQGLEIDNLKKYIPLLPVMQQSTPIRWPHSTSLIIPELESSLLTTNNAGQQSLQSPVTSDLDNEETSMEPGYVMIHGKKVDELKLQQAKIHPDAAKCALQLMSVLFDIKELVNGNPSGITNSKDEARLRTIKRLDPKRMLYIKEYVEEKWPGRYNVISKKLTQKCTDMYNNRKDLRDS